MNWTHEVAVKLTAPPARVFTALTDAAELRAWFAEAVEVGSGVGAPYRFWGRYTLDHPTEAAADQAITAWEPGRRLGFSWRVHGVPSVVTLQLEPHGEAGTQLKLRQEFAEALPLERPRELIDDHWRFVCGNLMMHLDGGAGIVRPDFTDRTPEVRLSIEIDAPPEAVYRALLEPESVNRWFDGKAAEVEPVVGGRYRLNWSYKVGGRDVEGGPTRILALEPNRKLVLDWLDWRGDANVTGQTITFLLEPAGQGTRVTFVHAGFSRTADIGDYPFGWVYFMDQLKAELARG